MALKFFIGTAGAAQTFLEQGINAVDIKSFGDGKLLIIYEGKAAPIGEPIIQEKIIEVDNPELLTQIDKLKNTNLELSDSIKFKDDEIKALKGQIASFATENADLNKDLDACRKENLSLKQQNGKLKKALEAI